MSVIGAPRSSRRTSASAARKSVCPRYVTSRSPCLTTRTPEASASSSARSRARSSAVVAIVLLSGVRVPAAMVDERAAEVVTDAKLNAIDLEAGLRRNFGRGVAFEVRGDQALETFSN